MKLRFSLRGQILLCAALNVALLIAAVFLFVQIEFETGFQSILLAPLQARIRGAGEEIANALGETPVEGRSAMLHRVEQRLRVELGLFLNNGDAVGGSLTRLPAPVVHLLRAPNADGPPGPPQKAPKKGGPRPPPPELRDPLVDRPPREQHMFLVREEGQYWIGLRMPIAEKGQDYVYLGTLMLRTPSLLLNPRLFDARPWVAAVAILGGIALLCWLPLIRSLNRSLARVTAGAEQIAHGQFDLKLAPGSTREMEQLSESLNRVASQLDGFVSGQKRFLGDIAHELTAPIARMQFSVGILEESAAEQQRRYVDGVREELQHMSSLVNELLQFSKAGLKPKDAPRERVPVRNVVQRVLERETTPGSALNLTSSSELEVLAAPDAVFRALSNVVRNAVRYAGNDGPITVSAEANGGNIDVIVADEGPGLPEDAVEKVFAPFYRLDRSRSRESGGVGLGLAIVKASVEANGGTVRCRNRSPRGLEVRLSLPKPASVAE